MRMIARSGRVGHLAWMIHLGADVQYVTVADDRVGSRHPDIYPEQLAKIRVQEQEIGVCILGVSSDRRLGWRDSEVLAPYPLREPMSWEIRTFRPRFGQGGINSRSDVCE